MRALFAEASCHFPPPPCCSRVSAAAGAQASPDSRRAVLLPLPQALFHMTASLQDDWDSRLLEFDRAVRSAAPFW